MPINKTNGSSEIPDSYLDKPILLESIAAQMDVPITIRESIIGGKNMHAIIIHPVSNIACHVFITSSSLYFIF